MRTPHYSGHFNLDEGVLFMEMSLIQDTSSGPIVSKLDVQSTQYEYKMYSYFRCVEISLQEVM